MPADLQVEYARQRRGICGLFSINACSSDDDLLMGLDQMSDLGGDSSGNDNDALPIPDIPIDFMVEELSD